MDGYPIRLSGSGRISTPRSNPAPAGLHVACRIGFLRVTIPVIHSAWCHCAVNSPYRRENLPMKPVWCSWHVFWLLNFWVTWPQPMNTTYECSLRSNGRLLKTSALCLSTSTSRHVVWVLKLPACLMLYQPPGFSFMPYEVLSRREFWHSEMHCSEQWRVAARYWNYQQNAFLLQSLIHASTIQGQVFHVDRSEGRCWTTVEKCL